MAKDTSDQSIAALIEQIASTKAAAAAAEKKLSDIVAKRLMALLPLRAAEAVQWAARPEAPCSLSLVAAGEAAVVIGSSGGSNARLWFEKLLRISGDESERSAIVDDEAAKVLYAREQCAEVVIASIHEAESFELFMAAGGEALRCTNTVHYHAEGAQ